MRLRTIAALAVLPLSIVVAGCNNMPGDPHEGPPPRPDQVMDFHTLYEQNCQACHGVGGQNGPAIDHANPEFQALVDDATLRRVISNGLPETQMPAFAQSAGGMLTDAQINAIIAGMRKEWSKPNAFGGATPPPLASTAAGDVQRGQQAYQARCASCHQGKTRQQITSPVYLSLVGDDALRTIIIAGRPDIGQPDWRHDTPTGAEGQPLSAQEVTDIVSYLHSLRNPDAVSAAPVPVPPRR